MGANVSFLQSDTVSDAMAAAYQFCVGKLPDIARSLSPSGLVIRVTLSGETTFNIFAKSFAAAPITKISNVTGVTSCSMEGQPFSIGQPINFDAPRNEFTGTCQRASPSDQQVAISTNEGVSNVVAIPAVVSPLNLLEVKINQLNSEMIRKTQEAEDQAKQIVADRIAEFQRDFPQKILASVEFIVRTSGKGPKGQSMPAQCMDNEVLVGGSCMGRDPTPTPGLGPELESVDLPSGSVEPLNRIMCHAPYRDHQVAAMAICMRPKKRA